MATHGENEATTGEAVSATSADRSVGWNWKKGLTRPLPRYPPITPRTQGGPVDLSFGQQRLWFLAQLDSGSAAYNVPMAWRLAGSVDVPALQRSLDRLVERHEALRTSFPAELGQPRQVIAPPEPARLAVVDLRELEAFEREAEVEKRVRDEARRPFQLATGPVFRAALFRLTDQEQIFVLVLHHIICDGPSIAVLLEELGAFYEYFLSGSAISLPTPPVQYADFTLWQRSVLDEKLRATELAYWREQLHDGPAGLDFPSDGGRLDAVRFRGGMEYRDLSAPLSEEFRALSRRHGVTRFMSLLALFQVLLARYTGQGDVSIGCPMTHRTRAEVSRVVGFFANMMVLRSQLAGNPTFQELLKRTREVALGAYAHHDLPFEELVAELQPERVPGRNPYFQAMLVVEESAWRQLPLAGANAVPYPVHNGTAKFDFSLYVIDDPAGFRLALEYNADLCQPEGAALLLEHFENLLHGVVAEPTKGVFDLPLLSASERTRLLTQWNDTWESPFEGSAPSLFEKQVEHRPDALAVTFLEETLSYRELNERANRLARHLVKLGAKEEALVAVSLERSLDLIVTLLAVMKSGAAYLPLDPAHPAERRDNILRDSGAELLVTNRARADGFAAPDDCVMLSLEDEKPEIARQSSGNLDRAVQPAALAYVIYTSGSTGRPKGVQVEQGNLANFLSTMRRRPGLTASDILLAVTTVSFDIAGLEFWLPLTTGASIMLADREAVNDPHELIRLIEKSGVTVLQATPSTWEMLLAVGWKGNKRLKALCGGEAVSGTLANELRARCGSVWNMYGPTETTIWSSIYEAQAGEEASVVPIGRPIGNTTLYVLDQARQPVPLGVRGELFIGGAGVARGYRGLSELTAEKFVPDPFSDRADGRLYRTGDAVRQRQDGVFEFLGRMDRQTKIRGYRIEPAEIETVLRQYPGLLQAAVAVRDREGENELVAYLVGSGPADQGKVSKFLREKLPVYMVPSAFVCLDELPLTPNGKLDWKALPAPECGLAEAVSVPPRDAIETRLARIWEEVLDFRPVGVTDSFFDLGGHSVLGTRLFARLEKEFSKRLPLGVLFEAPTIEKLAAILRAESWLERPLLEVQAGNSSTPPLFLVQARVGYRALAAELGSERPVYVVPTDDLFERDPERSLEDVGTELAQRIRAQHPQGPYCLGGMCLAGRVALAVARELCRQGEEVAFLGIVDMSAPGCVRLSSLPPWRNSFNRLRWHTRYALRSSARERLEWAAGAGRALVWQLRYRSWQLARGFYRGVNRPLPRSLRHVSRLLAEAADRDPPASYPGRITLFRPSERTEGDLGWGRIAAGGVDVHEIAGLKRALLRENATEVGRRLRECLPK